MSNFFAYKKFLNNWHDFNCIFFVLSIQINKLFVILLYKKFFNKKKI